MCDFGQDGVGQKIDVVIAAGRVFRGDGVGAQEGGHHVHGMGRIQLGHDGQLFDFGLQVQTIAALAFRRGDAHGQHGVQSALARSQKFFWSGTARSADGVSDAAAALHDLHVADALQAPGEFVGTITAEDEVGV